MNKRTTKAISRHEVPLLHRPVVILAGLACMVTLLLVTKAIASTASAPIATAAVTEQQTECAPRLLSARTCWIDAAVDSATR
jgi:hypothetical protein